MKCYIQARRNTGIVIYKLDETQEMLYVYVPSLLSRSKAYIPPLLLHAYRCHQPITASMIINNSSSLRHNSAHIAEIAQWGTMIIFDYLTGNYDR